jgi:NB-ARC domain
MVESVENSKRYRGFVLTSTGLEKLQAQIQSLELKTGIRQNPRAIAERIQLIEPDGIHPVTVRKLLQGQQGVDKRSIHYVFAALQIPLEAGDYAHASLLHQASDEFKDLELLAIPNYCGRVEERSQLQRKILVERCRLIMVLGAAGIGKTALVNQLAIEVRPAFELFVWKSLSYAPSLIELLIGLLQSLFQQLGHDVSLPTTVEGLMTELLKLLQQHRCLIVLDRVDIVLGDRPLAGYYLEGFEPYGEIFRAIAESRHNSCFILTSQEKPRGFKRLENQFVHLIRLQGLHLSDSQALLENQGVYADQPTHWLDLIDYYDGNPLLLKLGATQIMDYFNGNLSTYLNEVSQEQWLFQDIRDSLNQQFSRISDLEKQVMIHLANAGDWVSLQTLQRELNTVISRQELLDLLDSLSRRSLFQKSGSAFKLSVVMAEFIKREQASDHLPNPRILGDFEDQKLS